MVQDSVITRALTFSAESTGGKPDEWIEPLDGAGEAGNPSDGDITVANVGELVQQHGLSPLRFSVQKGLRDHDAGAPSSDRYR